MNRYKEIKSLITLVAIFSLVLPVFGGEEILVETFDAEGDVEAYTGEGKFFYSFADSSEENEHVREVIDGVLRLGYAGSSYGTSMNAMIDFGKTCELLSVAFDYNALELTSVSSQNGIAFYFGTFPVAAFNPNWHPSWGGAGPLRCWAVVVVKDGPDCIEAVDDSNAKYQFEIDKETVYRLSFFFNETGETKTFTGPDRLEYELETEHWSFFVDDELVADNITKGTSGQYQYLRGIGMKISRNYTGAKSLHEIDNFVVRDDLMMYGHDNTTLLMVW